MHTATLATRALPKRSVTGRSAAGDALLTEKSRAKASGGLEAKH